MNTLAPWQEQTRMQAISPSSRLTSLLALPRPDLVAALAAAFPDSVRGPGRDSVGGISGGRKAADDRLERIDPVAYGQTRNHVGGAVTTLSPWIRHGIVSLAEVRDVAIARVARPEQAAKLVSELGWRDYWRQVQLAIGDRIRDDIETPAATPRATPLETLPDDVLEARTGMACIDHFVRTLHDTGWLHNHERMWLASWLVHVRGVRWRAGADWFLEHLLDGDPASNHLSWQWIAGTFSAKPYVFTRAGLESCTDGVHCRRCPVLGSCAVEGSPEEVASRLFADATPPSRPPLRIRPAPPRAAGAPGSRPLVWLTLDSAAATSPAAAAHLAAPRLFVIDDAWLREERPAVKRLVFLCECLAEIPGLELVRGDPAELVPAHAAALGCDSVAVAETTCPRDRRSLDAIATTLPVAVAPWPRFCDRSGADDLGRFSRWWRTVSESALRPTARDGS